MVFVRLYALFRKDFYRRRIEISGRLNAKGYHIFANEISNSDIFRNSSAGENSNATKQISGEKQEHSYFSNEDSFYFATEFGCGIDEIYWGNLIKIE